MFDELERDWLRADALQNGQVMRVWRDYVIRADSIRRKGKRITRRAYYPITQPGLVSEIAKIEPGDGQSALNFVRRWGLLGYGNLWEQRYAGDEDPLWWIGAHARGIRVVLRLLQLLGKGDDSAVEDFLLTLFQPEEPDAAPELIYGVRGRIGHTQWPLRTDPRTVACRMVATIINENDRGVLNTLRVEDDGPPALAEKRRWDSLLSVAYWHLHRRALGSPVQECKNPRCRSLFFQARSDQVYCPPQDPDAKESACAAADRQRRRRKRRKGA